MARADSTSFQTCNPRELEKPLSLHPRPVTYMRTPRGELFQKVRKKLNCPLSNLPWIPEMFYYVVQRGTHPALITKGHGSELKPTLFLRRKRSW